MILDDIGGIAGRHGFFVHIHAIQLSGHDGGPGVYVQVDQSHDLLLLILCDRQHFLPLFDFIAIEIVENGKDHNAKDI